MIKDYFAVLNSVLVAFSARLCGPLLLTPLRRRGGLLCGPLLLTLLRRRAGLLCGPLLLTLLRRRAGLTTSTDDRYDCQRQQDTNLHVCSPRSYSAYILHVASIPRSDRPMPPEDGPF